MKLFLCGDVMTGRGIDQVLSHPSNPVLHEPYVLDARDYVTLAEQVSGPIRRPVDPSAIWGDALAVFSEERPDVRIINLETSITTSDAWEEKGINYRMHPRNIGFLTTAALDVCVLANNHVLDWGEAGLRQTLKELHKAGIKTAGAGHDLVEARAPAIITVPNKGRVLVYSLGTESSGIPPEWAAAAQRPGVNFLADFSSRSIQELARAVQSVKEPNDLVVVSIHWGGNWGYDFPPAHQTFAKALIDEARVDVVHGHSSHHALGIEVYKSKLILFGCGDLISDYEGIKGYERFRGDLALMYFPSFESSTGELLSMKMRPMRQRKFRLTSLGPEEGRLLAEILTREGQRLGTRVVFENDGGLTLQW
jgi:poly-gamma-glutamate synthesis protein (capsule biosynthesis protein)